MANNNELTPTLTLAKMYEQQGNYPEALAVYQKLDSADSDEFITKKINYLQDLVKTENRKIHDEIDSIVLSQSEQSLFQIEEKKYRSDSTSNRYENDPASAFRTSNQMINIFGDRFSDMTIEQLAKSLTAMIGKNRKLKNITIAEFINAIERI